MSLENKLKTKLIHEFKPIFFDVSKSTDAKKISQLLKKHREIKTNDNFLEQLEELFFTKNPGLVTNPSLGQKKFQEHLKSLKKNKPFYKQGTWVYFPWLNSLNHILNEQDFFLVRTSRNKHLITTDEQKQFYNAKIGIGGLSIGSSVAIALVLQGGAKYLKLADFDKLALSNTNRIRAGVEHLGSHKLNILCKQIYEINPYTKIEIFPEGITEKNVAKFVRGLNILVDELDNLAAKLLLRIEAKKYKVPVVMGADNGNSAVIDVERYDKNPSLKFFHNRLGNISLSELTNLNKAQIGQYIGKLIGMENHEERMLKSLHEIGKTIVSWPQLGGTAMLNAATISYIVRQICSGNSKTKNRTIISLNTV